MQIIFDKEICGEKDHEKENEKYAGDIAFLGSSTTSAAIFDIKTQDTHTLWCLFIAKKVLKMYYKHFKWFLTSSREWKILLECWRHENLVFEHFS